MVILGFSVCAYPAFADTAQETDQKVDDALKMLYTDTPKALGFSKIAKGILVFSDILKGDLIVVDR
jgi:hypothetical protein